MPKLGSGFPDTEYTYERNALVLTVVDRSFRREQGASQAAEKVDSEGGGGFNPRIKPAESAGFSRGGMFLAVSTQKSDFFRSLFSPLKESGPAGPLCPGRSVLPYLQVRLGKTFFEADSGQKTNRNRRLPHPPTVMEPFFKP
jgi:hypothetical protein